MNKKLAHRALSLALCAAMLTSVLAMGAGAADSQTGPKCDEAYYATMDYYGNLKEGGVVKSYEMNGAKSITDYGTYDQVDNLTDGTEPTVSDGRVEFNFTDSTPDRFYFEGKTTKPFEDLPWTLNVSYQLNGVKTDADQLAGKTGVVEIDIDAVPYKGASEYMRDNFVLTAATAFNDSDILSLKADGGQVQLLGNLRTVIFMAMPGEEQHFVIQVGTNDFTFSGMTFLLMPVTLSQLDQLKTLKDDKDDVEDAYNDISDSLDKVLDAMDGMSDSLNSTANGLDTLDTARSQVSSGKGAVYASSDAALNDLGKISDAMKPVSGYLESASSEVTELTNTVNTLSSTTTSLKAQLAETRTLITKTQADVTKLQALVKDIESYNSDAQDEVDGIRSDISDLTENVDELEASLKSLYTALNTLKSYDMSYIAPVTIEGYSVDEFETILNQVTAQHTAYAQNSLGCKDFASYCELMLVAKSVAAAQGTTADTLAKSLYQSYMTLPESSATTLSRSNFSDFTAYSEFMVMAQQAAAKQGTDASTLVTQLFTAYATGDKLTSLGIQSFGEYGEFMILVNGIAAAKSMQPTDVITQVIAPYMTANKCTALTAAENLAGQTGYQEAAKGAASMNTLYEASQSTDLVSQINQAKTINNMIGTESSKASDGTVNNTINEVNYILNTIVTPTTTLADDLKDLCAELNETDGLNDHVDDVLQTMGELLDDMKSHEGEASAVLGDANSAGTVLSETTAKADAILDQLDKLDQILNKYEPTVQSALKDGKNLTAATSDGLVNLKTAMQSLEDLMKTSGKTLDTGTQQSLSGISDALRQSTKGLDQTDSLRDAKKTITDKIDDEWDSHTGEDNNILLMDPDAPAVSLTSDENQNPASVQILLRTQEIKESDDSENTAVQNSGTKASGTFWSRLGQMFKDFWHALTSIFH